jgi:hypothetical protein
MNWFLVIGVLAVIALLYVFKKHVDATPDPSKEEIAATINDFIEGKGGPHDWDNFTTYPLKNPELEKIRKECFEIGIAYPGKKKTEWCSDEGVAELRRIHAQILKTA